MTPRRFHSPVLAAACAMALVVTAVLFPTSSAVAARLAPKPAAAPAAAPADPPLQLAEAEPNDSAAAAQDIGGGNAIVTGSAQPSDPGEAATTSDGTPDNYEDHYKFTLTQAATIDITLDVNQGSDHDIFLCIGTDACAWRPNSFMHSTNNAGVDENISAQLGPGVYTISVSAFDADDDYANPGYTLTVLGGTNEPPTPTDLAVEISPASNPVAFGQQLEYLVTVMNEGEGASSFFIFGETPADTTIAREATSSPNVTITPTGVVPGDSGSFVIEVSRLEPGATAVVHLWLNVFVDHGTTFDNSVFVDPEAEDTNTENNSSTASVLVVEAAEAQLSWVPGANEGDAPTNATATLLNGFSSDAVRSQIVREPTGFNVYRSNQPNVQVSPGNFYASVPPGQTSTTVPVGPGGTFFVVTETSSTTGESAPSNEASTSVEGGTIVSVKLKGSKLTITGANFSNTVTVFVDGIPFSKAAKVKKANTRVQQSGTLVTGQPLSQYATPGRQVKIAVRNSNGGMVQTDYAR